MKIIAKHKTSEGHRKYTVHTNTDAQHTLNFLNSVIGKEINNYVITLEQSNDNEQIQLARLAVGQNITEFFGSTVLIKSNEKHTIYKNTGIYGTQTYYLIDHLFTENKYNTIQGLVKANLENYDTIEKLTTINHHFIKNDDDDDYVNELMTKAAKTLAKALCLIDDVENLIDEALAINHGD
jgi:hypothetical protein